MNRMSRYVPEIRVSEVDYNRLEAEGYSECAMSDVGTDCEILEGGYSRAKEVSGDVDDGVLVTDIDASSDDERETVIRYPIDCINNILDLGMSCEEVSNSQGPHKRQKSITCSLEKSKPRMNFDRFDDGGTDVEGIYVSEDENEFGVDSDVDVRDIEATAFVSISDKVITSSIKSSQNTPEPGACKKKRSPALRSPVPLSSVLTDTEMLVSDAESNRSSRRKPSKVKPLRTMFGGFGSDSDSDSSTGTPKMNCKPYKLNTSRSFDSGKPSLKLAPLCKMDTDQPTDTEHVFIDENEFHSRNKRETRPSVIKYSQSALQSNVRYRHNAIKSNPNKDGCSVSREPTQYKQPNFMRKQLVVPQKTEIGNVTDIETFDSDSDEQTHSTKPVAYLPNPMCELVLANESHRGKTSIILPITEPQKNRSLRVENIDCGYSDVEDFPGFEADEYVRYPTPDLPCTEQSTVRNKEAVVYSSGLFVQSAGVEPLTDTEELDVPRNRLKVQLTQQRHVKECHTDVEDLEGSDNEHVKGKRHTKHSVNVELTDVGDLSSDDSDIGSYRFTSVTPDIELNNTYTTEREAMSPFSFDVKRGNELPKIRTTCPSPIRKNTEHFVQDELKYGSDEPHSHSHKFNDPEKHHLKGFDSRPDPTTDVEELTIFEALEELSQKKRKHQKTKEMHVTKNIGPQGQTSKPNRSFRPPGKYDDKPKGSAKPKGAVETSWITQYGKEGDKKVEPPKKHQAPFDYENGVYYKEMADESVYPPHLGYAEFDSDVVGSNSSLTQEQGTDTFSELLFSSSNSESEEPDENFPALKGKTRGAETCEILYDLSSQLSKVPALLERHGEAQSSSQPDSLEARLRYYRNICNRSLSPEISGVSEAERAELKELEESISQMLIDIRREERLFYADRDDEATNTVKRRPKPKPNVDEEVRKLTEDGDAALREIESHISKILQDAEKEGNEVLGSLKRDFKLPKSSSECDESWDMINAAVKDDADVEYVQFHESSCTPSPVDSDNSTSEDEYQFTPKVQLTIGRQLGRSTIDISVRNSPNARRRKMSAAKRSLNRSLPSLKSSSLSYFPRSGPSSTECLLDPPQLWESSSVEYISPPEKIDPESGYCIWSYPDDDEYGQELETDSKKGSLEHGKQQNISAQDLTNKSELKTTDARKVDKNIINERATPPKTTESDKNIREASPSSKTTPKSLLKGTSVEEPTAKKSQEPPKAKSTEKKTSLFGKTLETIKKPFQGSDKNKDGKGKNKNKGKGKDESDAKGSQSGKTDEKLEKLGTPEPESKKPAGATKGQLDMAKKTPSVDLQTASTDNTALKEVIFGVKPLGGEKVESLKFITSERSAEEFDRTTPDNIGSKLASAVGDEADKFTGPPKPPHSRTISTVGAADYSSDPLSTFTEGVHLTKPSSESMEPELKELSSEKTDSAVSVVDKSLGEIGRCLQSLMDDEHTALPEEEQKSAAKGILDSSQQDYSASVKSANVVGETAPVEAAKEKSPSPNGQISGRVAAKEKSPSPKAQLSAGVAKDKSPSPIGPAKELVNGETAMSSSPKGQATERVPVEAAKEKSTSPKAPAKGLVLGETTKSQSPEGQAPGPAHADTGKEKPPSPKGPAKGLVLEDSTKSQSPKGPVSGPVLAETAKGKSPSPKGPKGSPGRVPAETTKEKSPSPKAPSKGLVLGEATKTTSPKGQAIGRAPADATKEKSPSPKVQGPVGAAKSSPPKELFSGHKLGETVMEKSPSPKAQDRTLPGATKEKSPTKAQSVDWISGDSTKEKSPSPKAGGQGPGKSASPKSEPAKAPSGGKAGKEKDSEKTKKKEDQKPTPSPGKGSSLEKEHTHDQSVFITSNISTEKPLEQAQKGKVQISPTKKSKGKPEEKSSSPTAQSEGRASKDSGNSKLAVKKTEPAKPTEEKPKGGVNGSNISKKQEKPKGKTSPVKGSSPEKDLNTQTVEASKDNSGQKCPGNGASAKEGKGKNKGNPSPPKTAVVEVKSNDKIVPEEKSKKTGKDSGKQSVLKSPSPEGADDKPEADDATGPKSPSPKELTTPKAGNGGKKAQKKAAKNVAPESKLELKIEENLTSESSKVTQEAAEKQKDSPKGKGAAKMDKKKPSSEKTSPEKVVKGVTATSQISEKTLATSGGDMSDSKEGSKGGSVSSSDASALLTSLASNNNGKLIEKEEIFLVSKPLQDIKLGTSIASQGNGNTKVKKIETTKSKGKEVAEKTSEKKDDFEHIQKDIDGAKTMFDQFVGFVSDPKTSGSKLNEDERRSVSFGKDTKDPSGQEVEIPLEKEDDLLMFQKKVKMEEISDSVSTKPTALQSEKVETLDTTTTSPPLTSFDSFQSSFVEAGSKLTTDVVSPAVPSAEKSTKQVTSITGLGSLKGAKADLLGSASAGKDSLEKSIQSKADQTTNLIDSKKQQAEDSVGSAMSDFGGSVKISAQHLESSVPDVLGSVKAAKDDLTSSVSTGKASLEDSFGSLANQTKSLIDSKNKETGESLSAAMSDFGGTIKDSAKHIETSASDVLGSVKGAKLSSSVSTGKASLEDSFGSLANQTKSLIDSKSKETGESLGVSMSGISGSIEYSTEEVESSINEVLGSVKGAKAGLSNVVVTGKASLDDSFESLANQTKSVLDSKKKQTEESVGTAMSGIGGSIADSSKHIESSFTDVLGYVKGAKGDLSSSASTGKALLEESVQSKLDQGKSQPGSKKQQTGESPGAAMTDFGGTIKSSVQHVESSVADVLGSVKVAKDGLSSSVVAGKASLDDSFQSLANQTKSVLDSKKKQTEESVGAAMSDLGGSIKSSAQHTESSIHDVLGSAAAAKDDLSSSVSIGKASLAESVQSKLDQTKSVIDSKKRQTEELVGSAVSNFGGTIKDSAKHIETSASDVLGSVKGAKADLSSSVSSGKAFLEESVQSKLNQATSLIDLKKKQTNEFVGSAISGLGGRMKDSAKHVETSVTDVLGSVEGAKTDLSSSVLTGQECLGATISEFGGSLKDSAKQAQTTATGVLSSTVSSGKALLVESTSQTPVNATKAMASTKEELSSVLSNVGQLMGTVEKSFFAAGPGVPKTSQDGTTVTVLGQSTATTKEVILDATRKNTHIDEAPAAVLRAELPGQVLASVASTQKLAEFETLGSGASPELGGGLKTSENTSSPDEIGQMIREMESQLLSSQLGDRAEVVGQVQRPTTMPTTPMLSRKTIKGEQDPLRFPTRQVSDMGDPDRPVVRVTTEHVGDLSESEPEEETYTVLEPEVRERRKFKIRLSPDMYESEGRDGVEVYDESGTKLVGTIARVESDKPNAKSEKKIKHMERRFDRVASQSNETDPTPTEMDVEFQKMVSQLSLEEMDQALHQWDVGGLTPSEIDSKDLTLSSDETVSPLQQGLSDIFRPKLSSILPTTMYVEEPETDPSRVTEFSKMKLSLVKGTVPQIYQSVEQEKLAKEGSHTLEAEDTEERAPVPPPRTTNLEPTTHTQDQTENAQDNSQNYSSKKMFWEQMSSGSTESPPVADQEVAPPVPKPRIRSTHSQISDASDEKAVSHSDASGRPEASETGESDDDLHGITTTESVARELTTERMLSLDCDTNSEFEFIKSHDIEELSYDNDAFDDESVKRFSHPEPKQRKTIYERSASLPGDTTLDVTNNIRTKKRIFEAQIKKEMVVEQLMSQMEEEGSPERKSFELQADQPRDQEAMLDRQIHSEIVSHELEDHIDSNLLETKALVEKIPISPTLKEDPTTETQLSPKTTHELHKAPKDVPTQPQVTPAMAEVLLYKTDSISKPSDSLEVHVDKSELEDSEKEQEIDEELRIIEEVNRQVVQAKVSSITSSQGESEDTFSESDVTPEDARFKEQHDIQVWGPSEKEKPQVLSTDSGKTQRSIHTPEEHLPDTVWEVPVQESTDSLEVETLGQLSTEVVLKSPEQIGELEARKIADILVEEMENELILSGAVSEGTTDETANVTSAATKKSTILKLIRTDTATSSMEITDEDLRSSGITDNSPFESQLGQLLNASDQAAGEDSGDDVDAREFDKETIGKEVVDKTLAEVKQSLEAVKEELIEEKKKKRDSITKESPSEFEFKSLVLEKTFNESIQEHYHEETTVTESKTRTEPAKTFVSKLPVFQKETSIKRETVDKTETISQVTTTTEETGPHGKTVSKDSHSEHISSMKTSNVELSDGVGYLEKEDTSNKQDADSLIDEARTKSDFKAMNVDLDDEKSTKIEHELSVDEERKSPLEDVFSTSSSSDYKGGSNEGSTLDKPNIIIRKHKKTLGAKDPKSDGETYSSSGSHYESFEQTSESVRSPGSRPLSSDIEGLVAHVAGMTTGSSEYESAVSHEVSGQTFTSKDYHTAVSSLSSRDSMKSLDSESSGNLASMEVSSEASETLVPSAMELERDVDDQTPSRRQYTTFTPEEPVKVQSFSESMEQSASFDVSIEEMSEDIDMNVRPEDISQRMKRSHEMTFQPEPRPILVEGAQALDEKCSSSLDDMSSMLGSTTDTGAVRTVIELSRTESDRMDGSATSDQFSLTVSGTSDIMSLSESKEVEDTTMVSSMETVATQSPSLQGLPSGTVESVTITTSSIVEQGIQSVCTQVTSKVEVHATPNSNGPTQVDYNPEADESDHEVKKRGHRRNGSTSVRPSMIPVFHREIKKTSDEIMEDSAESDKYTQPLTVKEGSHEEKKDIDERLEEESYKTEADQAMQRDYWESRISLSDAFGDNTKSFDSSLGSKSRLTSTAFSEDRPDSEIAELLKQCSSDIPSEDPIERPKTPEPTEDCELRDDTPELSSEAQASVTELEMEYTGAYSRTVEYASHVSSIREKGLPMQESWEHIRGNEDDINDSAFTTGGDHVASEKHELETHEEAIKEKSSDRSKFVSSPVPDITVTQHMHPSPQDSFESIEIEQAKREAQTTEVVEPRTDRRGEDSASESPTSDSFELLEKPDISDEFVIIEEVGREASEQDTEGKSIKIDRKRVTARPSNTAAPPIVSPPSTVTKMTQVKYYSSGATEEEIPFEFDSGSPAKSIKSEKESSQEGSPPSAEEPDYKPDLEASKKWMEMQFQGEAAAQVFGYDMDYERGPLEDIKEEDINDLEGSSKIGSMGSQVSQSIGSYGSVKESLSSTPDYDVLAGRKFFTRSGEHDDVSMSSLQEFERLETLIALESTKHKSLGSQDSLTSSSNSKKHGSKSGGDDISLASLKEFEGLESACIAAEKIETKAKADEESLLSEIEEGHESQASESESCATISVGAVQRGESDEDDYERRMFEIDEIIRQAQTNVEQFMDSKNRDVLEGAKSETIGRADSLEEISRVPELDLDQPMYSVSYSSGKRYIQQWDDLGGEDLLTDSLKTQKTKTSVDPFTTSTDSLEVKISQDVMSVSTDSIEAARKQKKPDMMTDSIEVEKTSMLTSVDSLEGKVTQADSIDEDEHHVLGGYDQSSSSGKEGDLSSGNSAEGAVGMNRMPPPRAEYMLGSTDSLEPTSSTATHATYQYETDSVMSSSFTSGDSATMVDDNDEEAAARASIWFDEGKPYVTEVIEPIIGDEEFSHIIHRKVEMPPEIHKVSFKGQEADHELRDYIEKFDPGEDCTETREVDEHGNVHVKRVIQKRVVIRPEQFEGTSTDLTGPELEKYLQTLTHTQSETEPTIDTIHESHSIVSSTLRTTTTTLSQGQTIKTEQEQKQVEIQRRGSRPPLKYDISVDEEPEFDPREHDWRFNLHTHQERDEDPQEEAFGFSSVESKAKGSKDDNTSKK